MSLGITERVYFVGAGGIGMSALVRYFLSQGKAVAGYDRVSTPLTDQLSREGVRIHFEDNVELIPGEFRDAQYTLVIYTPAIPAGHSELNFFRNNDFRVVKRSVVLGEIFNTGRGIGVAGTHGKTSISTTLSQIMHESSLGCNAFLGGISKNSGSNFYLDSESEIIIAEADEFDRSFLALFPEVAVLSSMDADHLDIYETRENIRHGFEAYLSQIREGGILIYKHGLDPHIPDHVNSFTYALEDEAADYYLSSLEMKGISSVFSLKTPDGIMESLELGIPGILNVENAVAAVAVAHQMGLPRETIARNLAKYRGVERRFDIQVYERDRIYIDDYAHHPTEIKAFLSSVRKMFPGRKLTGIFQPHLFSRTRDFAEEFASSLELLDVLILMQIYPAREEPIPGVSASVIFEQVGLGEKVLVEREQIMRVIEEQDPDLLVTMGAGDINQFVAPLRNWMESRK